MTRFSITTILCLIITLCTSLHAGAIPTVTPWEELEILFPEQLKYGVKKAQNKWGVYVERVRLSKRTRNDDVKLAWLIYEDALKEETAAAAAVMSQMAYELGIANRDGYGAAIRSMELLASRHKRMRFVFFHKAAIILERWYRIEKGDKKTQLGHQVVKAHEAVADDRYLVGDDSNATIYYRRAVAVAKIIGSDRYEPIKDKLAHADLRHRASIDIKKELARLERNDADVIARRDLINHYIIGLDDPFMAFAYLKGVGATTEQKEMVPLAVKDLPTVQPDEALKLGEWYEQLSREAKHPQSVENMRYRAADYYLRYLTLDRRKSSKRDRVVLAMTTIAPDKTSLIPKADNTIKRVEPPKPKPKPPVVAKKPDKPDTKPTTKISKTSPEDEERIQKTITRRKSLRKDWADLKEKKDDKSRPSFFDIPLE